MVLTDGAELVSLLCAPGEATTLGRRSVTTSRKGGGQDGHRQVGNDGHQEEEEEVLHDARLERNFLWFRKIWLVLVMGRL